MNVLVNAEFDGKGTESKALSVVKAQVLKTKTKAEFQFDAKAIPTLDLQHDLASDAEALGVEALPMSHFSITVEGVPAIGRMINRSTLAFSKIGIFISPLEWEDESGVVEFMADELTGLDFPFLAEIALRIIRRSLRAMSYTHHPLTLFDLKQAAGMVYDLQQGTDGAEELMDWVNVREMVLLEEEKGAKAEVKAKAKAAKDAEKSKEKAAKAEEKKAEANSEDKAPKAKAQTKAQKIAAAKAKAALTKAKAKNSGKAKTANLADLA